MTDAEIAAAAEKAGSLPVSWCLHGDRIAVVAWGDAGIVLLGIVESRTVAQECVNRIDAVRKG